MTADRPQEWSLWPLRLFLGVTFTYAGLQKLANPDYLDPHSPTSVQATMLSLRHSSPIGWLLGVSAHAPVLVGVLIALGELSVGLATLFGLWVRVAALGGLLLSLTFFLTVSFHTHPYYYGSDIVFVAAWTVPLIAGAWPPPTLDAAVAQRAVADPDPRRRALLLGGVGAAALAVLTGALAGITAAVGRALHSGPDAAAGPAPTGSQPASTPSAKSGGSHSPSASRPGRHLVSADRVPPGEALPFVDNDGSGAWLVHESDGSFRAFSATCTHAGCSVSFSSGQFVCPCHGGRYSAQTGAVIAGPPPAPLSPIHVEVVEGDVRLL